MNHFAYIIPKEKTFEFKSCLKCIIYAKTRHVSNILVSANHPLFMFHPCSIRHEKDASANVVIGLQYIGYPTMDGHRKPCGEYSAQVFLD